MRAERRSREPNVSHASWHSDAAHLETPRTGERDVVVDPPVVAVDECRPQSRHGGGVADSRRGRFRRGGVWRGQQDCILRGIGDRAPAMTRRAAVSGPVRHQHPQPSLLDRLDTHRPLPARARRAAVRHNGQAITRSVHAVADEPAVAARELECGGGRPRDALVHGLSLSFRAARGNRARLCSASRPSRPNRPQPCACRRASMAGPRIGHLTHSRRGNGVGDGEWSSRSCLRWPPPLATAPT
jgi:hypothetical protein